MELSGFAKTFHHISLWIMRLAYLNLLWVLFSLAGGVILGVAPSTFATFTVLRKMVKGELDVTIFPFFWKAFKKSFLQGNVLLVVFIAIGFVLYYDLHFFKQMDGPFYNLLFLLFILLSFIYTVALCYIFPVFVHYKMTLRSYIKYAILIGIFSPVQTFFILAGLFLNFVLINLIPGLLPFFSISLPALLIMTFANRAFDNLVKKKSDLDANV